MKLINLAVNTLHSPIGISTENTFFSWISEAEGRSLKQRSYQLSVFNNEVLFWSSGLVESDESAYVPYKGPALKSGTSYTWTVAVTLSDGSYAVSEPETFETAIRPDKADAQWIESTFQPIHKEKAPMVVGFGKKPKFRSTQLLTPPTHFRKEFSCRAEITSARLYATAHGVYRAYLNGETVGNRLFAPEYTSYYQHLLFQTYDVTSMLQEGRNVLGVIVADGWWGGTLMNGSNCTYGNRHGLWLQLNITYADGTKQSICSDGAFRCGIGALCYSDLFVGEYYDARKELNGWSECGFDDSGWKPVSVGTANICKLCPQESLPIRVIRRFHPKALLRTPNGELVLDAGENIAGFLTLQITAPAGTKITMQHAEVLDKNGNYFHNLLYVNNHQLVTYICKGTVDAAGNPVPETYTPYFSWQGFRYVRLTGNVDFTIEMFTVNVISSDNKNIGSFCCSDDRINRLHDNIVRAQKGNLISIPTDCPQRERAGWTGDAEVFAPTACFNQDIRAFYRKWMTDLRCDQDESDAVPNVVPRDPRKFPEMLGTKGMAGWSDACIIIPYTIYCRFGDTQILRENYACMKRWLAYVESRTTVKLPRKVTESRIYQQDAAFRAVAHRLWISDFQYGDRLIPSLTTGNVLSIFKGANATREIFATGYYARTVEMMAEIARILGKNEDVEKYARLYQEIKTAYQLWFVDENGLIQPDYQGAIVISLQFGLLPENVIQKNVAHLVEKIHENGGCLDTGFLSVPYLLDALSQNGKEDEAYRLLYQDKCPSWMYELKMGATTFWESWSGIDNDGTPKPCSYNHYAFGSLGDWIYRSIGGLIPDEPGYKAFTIKPLVHKSLNSAEVSYFCPYGKIYAKWSTESGGFRPEVEVPVNTVCRMILPDGSKRLVGSGKYHADCPAWAVE